jgi:hypothetical protein
MHLTTTFSYSRNAVNEAVVAFWKRRNLHKRELILSALLLLGLIVLAYLRREERSNWGIALLTLCIFSFWLLRIGEFFWFRRKKLNAWRSLENGTVKVTVDDNGFTFTSAMGESQMAWREVKAISKLARIWLIVWSDFEFSFLPVEQISEEMKSFIAARVRDIA